MIDFDKDAKPEFDPKNTKNLLFAQKGRWIRLSPDPYIGKITEGTLGRIVQAQRQATLGEEMAAGSRLMLLNKLATCSTSIRVPQIQ